MVSRSRVCGGGWWTVDQTTGGLQCQALMSLAVTLSDSVSSEPQAEGTQGWATAQEMQGGSTQAVSPVTPL